MVITTGKEIKMLNTALIHLGIIGMYVGFSRLISLGKFGWVGFYLICLPVGMNLLAPLPALFMVVGVSCGLFVLAFDLRQLRKGAGQSCIGGADDSLNGI